ncbi:BTB/POZ and MATH domain-containing protein 1 [Oryza sativa Japonica Group]|jgi:speckle-type POZ protein|uniref:Os10g0435400 protein n=2 Tax=Oryza sativa subsp. japonica TaxID=39947 RepID=A0A8J8Y6L3_ORYSJ|nr:BTB/POZ and MATH domain-containing protein 1 [Oryza sativa Japonica Group]XP_025876657.1 BTB/POZ and MATH domain-containing protein 1 [Oryza sativa Japonica Group]XP_025876658.1 BTB/POZ and MATH domain-containing protein 1 [Oryza sativa Japonica Group]XP_025876659.1 BTB/POZ and MATH domain-containing protein 1 [Oryza sativa Japonica Group]XP_025876660.1 BTB/POZ and MATH domain-containing protein 1 [Oryza sativa Japonica Group]XP_025876661.1 BTB/POZ and MATH domain-containing protein 1 [Oryz|eukprot:NP_001064671.1 Os10g0435400 [Oryza sativa Japonica Group]
MATTTTSTVTTIAAQAYHVLKINGYSNTLKAGRHHPLSSCPFSAGGHTWHVSYYPHGCRDSNKDCISIFLVLEDIVTDEDVMAKATFSLLDRYGNPVPSYTYHTKLRNFSTSSGRARGFENFIRRDELERSEYLNDDYFAVAAHVIIPKKKPSVVVPPSNMHLYFGDLLVSKEGTDVKFLVGGEMFAAHRLVLAARSPVFKAELFGPTKKGTIDAIQIDNMEARVFKALLEFIYTDIWSEIGHGKDNVAMAQQLLAAADRYGLQRLKFVYEDKLCNHIDTCSVSTMLVLAEKHHCCKLKEACSTFLSFMSPPIVEDLNSSIFGSELEKTVSSSENHGSQINRTDIRIQPWQNADV